MKTTEQPNAHTEHIDQKDTEGIIKVINQEDATVHRSIREEITDIVNAVRVISKHLREGGSLIFIGAGTSGRLGVLQAAECPPTFGTEPEMVKAFIAGGKNAVFASKEGAEDNREAGMEVIEKYANPNDVVIGISASGSAPYVVGALEKAVEKEIETISLSCNKESDIGKLADLRIEVTPGPEVIAGSTRMKAGSSQKMVLDMLTTGSMIKIGKIKGNLMVNLQPKSEKLKHRAMSILIKLTNLKELDEKEAEKKAKEILEKHRYNLPAAIKSTHE